MVALVGSAVLVLVVNLTLKGLGVSRDLHNLKCRDVVTLALFASIAHGFSYTYVIFAIHNYSYDNFIHESMIIVMGGFFGLQHHMLAQPTKALQYVQSTINIVCSKDQ